MRAVDIMGRWHGKLVDEIKLNKGEASMHVCEKWMELTKIWKLGIEDSKGVLPGIGGKADAN